VLFDLIYIFLLVLLLPVFAYRILFLGKYRESLRQRWGNVPERAPGRTRVWVHAVSVGEVRAAEPLVAALARGTPEVEVVVSTATETGQRVARDTFGAERVFYFPFDFSVLVARTFERVRPSLLVLMELELWPNVLAAAKRRGVPVLVANGRLSERSFRRLRLLGRFASPILAPVGRWSVQTEEYAGRLVALGVESSRIEVSGNTKYDALPGDEGEEAAAAAAAKMRAGLGIRDGELVLLGGSTHRGEERALTEAWRELAPRFPGLRLVLAPRRPERFTEVLAEVAAMGLPVTRKTALAAGGERGADGENSRPVVVADTIGELRDIYRAATVVFVGGSLVPHGGQNILEPAALGKPVLFGPHVQNFRVEAEALEAGGGGVMVADAAGLAREIGRLLGDAESREEMGRRGREVVGERRGAAGRSAEIVREMLAAARPGT